MVRFRDHARVRPSVGPENRDSGPRTIHGEPFDANPIGNTLLKRNTREAANDLPVES